MRRVAQIRMGAYRLAIEEGRFSQMLRADRLCLLCQHGKREDDMQQWMNPPLECAASLRTGSSACFQGPLLWRCGTSDSPQVRPMFFGRCQACSFW